MLIIEDTKCTAKLQQLQLPELLIPTQNPFNVY